MRAASLVFLATALTASAFVPTTPARRGQMMMAERSTALPFADKPANLNGELTGDAGFDPFKFSDSGDLAKFRAAELKHGRVAMVACVGFLFQEHFQWNEYFPGKTPLEALKTAPFLGLVQIIVGIGAYETATKNYEGRVPGDLGFDPLRLSANGINEKWALSEIKHARLAMIGALGLLIQSFVSDKGILDMTYEWAKSLA